MPISEAQDALRIKEDRPSPGRHPDGFGWSGKTRFGGFFVARRKRTGIFGAPSSPPGPEASRHSTASARQAATFTYRDDLFDQPLQGRIPFTLRNADDIQPEAAEIEGQVKQLHR